MKIITIRPPWADAIATGAKRFETRSWSTSYRGVLGIHAGSGNPIEIISALHRPEFQRALSPLVGEPLDLRAEPRDFGVSLCNVHRGAIIAVCRLEGVFPMWELSAQSYASEAQLGDFSPDRYAWLLTNMVRLQQPIPSNGQLGLFSAHKQVRREILKQICKRPNDDPVILKSLAA